MNNVEERVSYLEGRIEEQATMVNGIREAIVSLEARMDRRFEQIEHRFALIDQRFVGIDRRLDGLDSKVDRMFVWLVGLLCTLLVAIIGGMGGIIAAILRT